MYDRVVCIRVVQQEGSALLDSTRGLPVRVALSSKWLCVSACCVRGSHCVGRPHGDVKTFNVCEDPCRGHCG